MESEQLQNFNERLSQWVSNQGFWFQVRYSMSVSGIKGQALMQLLKIAVRLLIFLLLAVFACWVYLVKRTDSARFLISQKTELQQAVSASEVELRGLRRSQGQLEITRIAFEGNDDTFFSTLEARNIRCKMGLLDGLVGVWKPGIISMAKLDIDLRAGANDAESASKLAAALFRKSNKVEISTIEVGSANLRWGYSERTWGSIQGSSLKIQRLPSGYRLNFKGGVFSQNWLNNLEIVSLVVNANPDGLVFERAELKQGASTVDFTGLRLTGGERPQIAGTAKIRNIKLEGVLPPALQSFLEGSISGDFKVLGSTNSPEGIGFEGQVVLNGENFISLRERIHVLRALSVVDYSRNYHRVDFREGSFQLKTLNGGLQLSEVNLKAEDLFTLDGKITVRLPTPAEIKQAIARGGNSENSPIFAAEDQAVMDRKQSKSGAEFTLKQAAEALRAKEGSQAASSSLFDRLGIHLEERQMLSMESERMSRMLRYEGSFVATIPGDAFERAPRLKELYPIDSSSGRIPITIPIEGDLYELTLKQAEETYQRGQR